MKKNPCYVLICIICSTLLFLVPFNIHSKALTNNVSDIFDIEISYYLENISIIPRKTHIANTDGTTEIKGRLVGGQNTSASESSVTSGNVSSLNTSNLASITFTCQSTSNGACNAYKASTNLTFNISQYKAYLEFSADDTLKEYTVVFEYQKILKIHIKDDKKHSGAIFTDINFTHWKSSNDNVTTGNKNIYFNDTANIELYTKQVKQDTRYNADSSTNLVVIDLYNPSDDSIINDYVFTDTDLYGIDIPYYSNLAYSYFQLLGLKNDTNSYFNNKVMYGKFNNYTSYNSSAYIRLEEYAGPYLIMFSSRYDLFNSSVNNGSGIFNIYSYKNYSYDKVTRRQFQVSNMTTYSIIINDPKNDYLTLGITQTRSDNIIIPLYFGAVRYAPDNIVQMAGLDTTVETNIEEINADLDKTNNKLDTQNTLINSGTTQSQGKATKNDTATTNFNTAQNQQKAIEEGVEKDFTSSMSNIPNDVDIIRNNNFLKSTMWVIKQWNWLITGTIFESVLGYSLLLGFALLIIGKVIK